jgi:hypothetical protein
MWTEQRFLFSFLPGLLKPDAVSEDTAYPVTKSVTAAATSVADPDPFDTNPDPAFHFDTDQDPAFQFDMDPNPTV